MPNSPANDGKQRRPLRLKHPKTAQSVKKRKSVQKEKLGPMQITTGAAMKTRERRRSFLMGLSRRGDY